MQDEIDTSRLQENLSNLVKSIYTEDGKKVKKHCREEMVWKVEALQLEARILKVECCNVHSLSISKGCTLVTGEFVIKTEIKVYMLELIVVVKNNHFVFVQTHVKGKNKVYQICTPNEQVHLINEEEIIYIESQHNKVTWHCVGKTIITNDMLGNIETELSDNFFRIHRCHIINKNHVNLIRRCEVEMSNGHVLAIPYKKYVHIKEKLLGQKYYNQ